MLLERNKMILIFLIIGAYFNSLYANQIKPCASVIFAYDAYLGFPVEEMVWQTFFNKHCVRLKPYKNIDKMVFDLKKHKITAAFLPAGAYYYLRNDPHYQGVVSATIHAGETKENAYLLVRKKSHIITLNQLKHTKFAYINRECTTSFFGMMLYLSQYNDTLNHFFDALISVDGFEGQIHALNHDTAIDSIMLWDVYWLKNKKLRESTRIIGKMMGLPTPVVILNTKVDETFKQAWRQQLMQYKSDKSTWIYTGFVPYQKKSNQQFWLNVVPLMSSQ